MTEIPDEIKQLSNAELRRELLKVGITPAPLTPTSKKLYQRKLARKLYPTLTDQEETKEQVLQNGTKVARDNATFQKTKSKSFLSSSLDSTLQPDYDDAKKETESNHDSYCYVVLAPSNNNAVSSAICEDRTAALKVLRSVKGSRLRRFSTIAQANDFARSYKSSPVPYKLDVACEKPNDYSAPIQVELSKLMAVIESNDLLMFDEMVWGNPRFLISAADGPVPLKASMRYNALHVAARANKPKMVRRILSVLESPQFLMLMYSSCSKRTSNGMVMQHIVDLYLNTPEKGCYDTPLHIACKFGYSDIVAELVAHPMCDKNARNKDGNSPVEVVCSRAKTSDSRKEIMYLLQDLYYVPLIRYCDDTEPPSIGQPWNPVKFASPFGKEKNLALDATPQMVTAVAGPMSRDQALSFHRKWATPIRKDPQARHHAEFRLRDTDRGEERVGREVARQQGQQWLEYWQFLGDYADFSTDEGLSQLENYLRQKERNVDLSLPPCDNSLNELSGQMSLMSIASPCVDFDSTSSEKMEAASPPQKSSPSRTTETRQFDRIKSNLTRRQLSRILRPTDPANHSHQVEVCSSATNTSGKPLPNSNYFSPHCPDSETSARPPGTRSSFITGSKPTKVDQDVLIALSSCTINACQYPFIHEWLSAVKSYSESERTRWKTPRKAGNPIRQFEPSQPIPPLSLSFTGV